MTGPLHDYQIRAVRFALEALAGPHHGCGLFLEPGLGKTLTSIAVMDILHRTDPTLRFLVVAPNLVARNSWPREFERWSDMHALDWAVACGTAAQRRKALARDATVTVINQENLVWLDGEVKDWPWRILIIDELSAHKSPQAKRFRVLRRRRRRMLGCLGLTGTPATKNLLDLWAEILLVDDGMALGTSITGYRERWFRAAKWIGRQIVQWDERPGARGEILSRLDGFCLSMKSADMLPGMPALLETNHWVGMPKDTRLLYESMRHDLVAEIGDGDPQIVSAANAGVMTAKLAQLTCGCLYPDRDDPDGVIRHVDGAKLDELERIVSDADGPVLVFYGFKDELDRMRARFPQLREVHEPGVTDAWNRGEVPLLAAQPAAAKYGLNIQHGGHEMVWTCLPWSYDDYRQACDRLHRQGQTRPVRVHRILSEDSVDARKLDVLQGRMRLHEAVMQALKS